MTTNGNLQTNALPEHLTERLKSLNEEIELQAFSFDASADGRKAVLLVCGEDLDFPELAVYDEPEDQLILIDSGDHLVDLPLGRAFWAEGDEMICVARHDEYTVYQLQVNQQWSIETMSEVGAESSHLQSKLATVEDFIRPSEATAQKNDPSNEAFDSLAASLKTQLDFMYLGAQGREPDDAREYLDPRLESYRSVFRAVQMTVSKFELDTDLEAIRSKLYGEGGRRDTPSIYKKLTGTST